MKVITCGIVTNQYGHVLLIQRYDSSTWAPPGGILEHGELPTEGVVREVREETGLIVMPVRLVALDFAQGKNNTLLLMTFRCIQRGGEIKTSAESLQVGWVKGNELPRSMLSYHRQRVEQAMTHTGGPPAWHVEQGGFGDRLHKLRHVFASIGKRTEQLHRSAATAPDWEIETAVIIQNNNDETLWVKSDDQWALPGAVSNGKQPPWETAVQATQTQTGHKATLTTLSVVYTNENKVTFVFSATIPETILAQIENKTVSFNTPDNVKLSQKSWIRDATSTKNVTIFR